METEADVIESLRAVGHDGKFLTANLLEEAISAGPKSESFRELITWIAFEIHVLRQTDEKIGKDTDFNEFMLEMSGLLKELGCPYSQFINGPLTSRLHTKESRMLLLDYLLTELMAMKMCLKLKPQENSYIIPMFESSTAKALESITKELNLGKPPGNIAAKALFEKIANRLDETIKKAGPKKLSQPLFKPTVAFNADQWEKLLQLQKEFDREYNLRRQMMLTRLEVTIQSFQWSEKMKGREEDIIKRYQKKKQILDQLQFGDIGTDIPALLAARQDLAIIEKTSGANVRKNTGTKLQKHIIGKVPDRGGRAYEHAPPPPEMPSWQQNRTSGPAGGRGGGNRGGGGGRGGRGGGGGGGNWNQQQQSGQYQGNSSTGGGYGQRQSFEQRQQFDNRDNQSFGGGNNNRVQGGWSQRGNDKNSFGHRGGDSGHFGSGDNSYRGNNQYNNSQGGNFSGQNQGGSYGGQNHGGNYGGQSQGGNYGGQSQSYGGNFGNGERGNFGSSERGNFGNGERGNYRGRSNYNRGGGGGGGNRR